MKQKGLSILGLTFVITLGLLSGCRNTPALPDEALDIVNGGGHSNASCDSPAKCPQCGSVNLRTYSAFGGSVSFITDCTCNDCGYGWKD